ncbi:MAG: ATP-binding protein [Thermoanaerobaculia bacterium]
MDTNGQTGPTLGVSGKLALGFAALLAILIFLGAESIALLADLGGSIEVILRENYKSVIACERMKESLERMDSAALFALGGEVERGRALAAQNHPRFEEALQIERNNITLPGERERAERLRQLYTSFHSTLDDSFSVDRPAAERSRIYFSGLLPVFQQIKDTADEILLMNQHAMERSDTRARDLARSAGRRMTLLLVLGTALAALSVYLLSRAILRPLGGLTRAAHEIEGGNLDASVPVTSRDELGRLAATFNSMAGGLRELRRSDQARLLRARQISQRAIDQLPEAVAAFSESGEVELVNATAASVLGLRPGEPLPAGHDWIASGSPEVRRLERDGEERFFLPRSIPLGDAPGQMLDETGHRLGTLLVLEDVTERRRSDELTSDLLAGASRDLRAPLASLRSSLGSMRGTAGGREALEAAVRDADRMARVLDNLEGITRLEERRQQLRVQAASPRDLIQAAADEFRPSYQRHGVKLAVEEAPELPRVLADAERIRLVLGFLLDNALAATKPGGSVTVRAGVDGERVRFAVTDTGCGIPEQHQGRLFERFYQVPGSEDRGRAGLGLSIARDIVQSHGGEIRLESQEGRGTTVGFTLPAARSAAA